MNDLTIFKDYEFDLRDKNIGECVKFIKEIIQDPMLFKSAVALLLDKYFGYIIYDNDKPIPDSGIVNVFDRKTGQSFHVVTNGQPHSFGRTLYNIEDKKFKYVSNYNKNLAIALISESNGKDNFYLIDYKGDIIDGPYTKIKETGIEDVFFAEDDKSKLCFYVCKSDLKKNELYYEMIYKETNNYHIFENDKRILVYNNNAFRLLFYNGGFVSNTKFHLDKNFKFNNIKEKNVDGRNYLIVNSETNNGKKLYYHFDIRRGKAMYTSRFLDVGEFIDGWSLVKCRVGYNYISSTGKKLLPKNVHHAKPFKDGYGVILKDIGKKSIFNIINTAGEVVSEISEEAVSVMRDKNLIEVRGDENTLKIKYRKNYSYQELKNI